MREVVDAGRREGGGERRLWWFSWLQGASSRPRFGSLCFVSGLLASIFMTLCLECRHLGICGIVWNSAATLSNGFKMGALTPYGFGIS